MCSKIIKCFLFLAVFQVLGSQASPSDEIKEEFMSMVQECSKEIDMSQEELKAMKGVPPTTDKQKCMFACSYKKTGMMDDNGKMSAEGIRNVGKRAFQNDEEKMKLLDEYINQCMSVNDAMVSDGPKGCERAALMYACNEKANKQLRIF